MPLSCLLFIGLCCSFCGFSQNGTTNQKKSSDLKAWTLVWSDEFNYSGLPDSSKWAYHVGGSGWGNNEHQYYTSNDSSTAHVSNGTLKIIATKQTTENKEYKSARLHTNGKATFKYGRIESSARVPSIAGTWPAIWMLGSDIKTVGWPACGEIDIMEHRGNEQDKIFGTLHYPNHSGGNGNGKTIMVSGATQAFHQYAVEWDASQMQFFVDDSLYFTVANDPSIPFNHNFFILINLAIGGNFGGKIDPKFSKDILEVDYIRVYTKKQ